MTSSPLPPLPSAATRRRFARKLLDWYAVHQRPLPWRGGQDPYAIWVSEVMLQQTQVATVKPYFHRWMQHFPNLASLADAAESEVLSVWQGLGYYSRARSLQRGARAVMDEHGGQLPRTSAELLRLPGVGPYTAGAIASIAFEQDAPIVDGNVVRVLTRVYALRGSPQRAPLKNYLWSLAGALIPSGKARDFNQALMEFGALCCTPKRPLCTQCPVRSECRALADATPEAFPETPPRPKVTRLEHAAALVTRRRRYLVVQLPVGAPRWASMWQFPCTEHLVGESPQAAAQRAAAYWCELAVRPGAVVDQLHHSVTRYRIQLRLVECLALGGQPRPAAGQAVAWCSKAELTERPMPAAHRKLVSRLGD